MQFRTHAGELVSGPRLASAIASVANDWAALARAIRAENAYASHVTEAEKDRAMQAMLLDAEAIRSGNVSNFTIWQRINTRLTGECVALLQRGRGARNSTQIDFG